MECLRCGNKDKDFFYQGSKGLYCRKCIRFKRILLDEEDEIFNYEISPFAGEYYFNYELTPEQKNISNKLKETLKNNNVLLNCICGAGKTEIMVESISDYLKRGLKVCFSISRKEVVIELSKRFKEIFKDSKVIAVYGGHHDILIADLIVCTCHQLYRYHKAFDLLIIDEADGFPLDGDEILMNIALNSSKGRIIFSSATTNEFLKSYVKQMNCIELSLNIRPSYKPLSIPKIYYGLRIFHFIKLFILLKRMKNQCIIFLPSVKLCKLYYFLFNKLISCIYVYANLDNRNNNINDFRNKKYQFIFATSVLERGITIENINVIILDYIKDIFKLNNLVQMLGRVGRSISNPYGSTYIFVSRYNPEIRKTINYLKEANSYL